jgi:hypothetical protein
MSVADRNSALTCSAQYPFLRGRQLEGTFLDDAATGVWPITRLRIMRGWGCVSEEAWPYDSANWPRVQTIQEIKVCLANWSTLVQVSLAITDKWSKSRTGEIPDPTLEDKFLGMHSVLVFGYDEARSQLKFRNSWGANWGESGNGYISYSAFENCWHEGWTADTRPTTEKIERPARVELSWALNEFGGGIFDCREFLSTGPKRIGWAFGVERSGMLEIEESFVMPEFRRRAYDAKPIKAIQRLADEKSLTLHTFPTLM